MFIYFFVYPFTLKNTKAKIIQYLTPISTFDALSKWHDPHISNVKTKWEIFFSICVAFSEYLYFISSGGLYQGCPRVWVTGVYIGPSLDKKAANVHMTYKDRKKN